MTASRFPTPPVLSATDAAAPPELPEKWHAIALLTPYDGGQLFAAEIWYDAALRALRVAAFGVDEGAVDLLFVGDRFFLVGAGGRPLWGPFPAPQPVPARDWLAGRGLMCQGRGRLLTADCDWWVGYTPNANGQDPNNPPKPGVEVCNWIWAHAGTGLPFRMFFNNTTNDYGFPVLGGFAMSHFTLSEAVQDTGLAPLVEAAGRATAAAAPDWTGTGLDGLLAGLAAVDPGYAASMPAGRAGQLVTGLKPAPADAPTPRWSDRLCITGYTLPTARPRQGMFSSAALPIRVFYDWPGRRMLTRASMDDKAWEGATYTDMILNDHITHLVARLPDGSHQCVGTQPVGLPKPGWAGDDRATPRAVIEDNPVLCPGQTVNVTVAPNPGPGLSRHFWLWYTAGMDGVMFIEVPQPGNVGLVVTDYYSFDHDPPPFPEAAFQVPADCLAKHAEGGAA